MKFIATVALVAAVASQEIFDQEETELMEAPEDMLEDVEDAEENLLTVAYSKKANDHIATKIKHIEHEIEALEHMKRNGLTHEKYVA